MVDVSVEIIDSDNLQPPRNFVVKYIVKTFWCKLEVEANNSVIRLPLLLVNDYRKNTDNKIGMTLFIEVWYAPTTTSMTMDNYSEPIFVGLSRFSLEDQLNSPNLNPVWTYLPIDKILEDAIAGKLAVIISATLKTLNGHDTGAYKNIDVGLERVSSYFSCQASDSAPVASPHLVNSNKNQVQIANRPAATSSKYDGNVNTKQRTTTTTKTPAKTPTITSKSTNVKKPNVRKFTTALQPDQDKKPPQSPSTMRYPQVSTPSKVPTAISHNIMTSPDFPFQIPAVQAVEKRITFDLNTSVGTRTNNYNYSRNPNAPVNNTTSPALFGYTPYTAKIRDENLCDDDQRKSTSNTPNDTNTMKVNDLLSVLDDNFNNTFGNQVEKLREHNKEAELTKKLLHQRDDKRSVGKEHHQQKRQSKAASIGHILSTMDLDTDPVRMPCSPKQNFTKAKLPSTSPPVPGMKITKYKPSSTEGSENFMDPFKSPSKRRIAANIYHD